MNFGEAIKSFFKNYAKFNGRASRKEYWYSFLFTAIFVVPLNIIARVLERNEQLLESDPLFYLFIAIGLFVISIGLIPPILAVGVRRLHDSGRSAWTMIWSFVPFVGAVILIYAMCEGSNDGTNKYGKPVKK